MPAQTRFLELITAQQQDLVGRAISRMIGDIEVRQREFDAGGVVHKHLQLDIEALQGVYGQLHNGGRLKEVGEAVEMPGTNAGFTMAVFNGKDVPVGTKVYA